MDFIYFNFFDLSLVAYLKAFAFNKKIKREVCYVRSAKLFFLSPLEISQQWYQSYSS